MNIYGFSQNLLRNSLRSETQWNLVKSFHQWNMKTVVDQIHNTRTNTRIGTSALGVAAPIIWNSLPLNVRDTLETFQSHLKAHFFSSAYNI